MKRHLTITLPVIASGLLGALLILFAWGLPPFTTGAQTTDNAYVRGAVTVISPQVPGILAEVAVQDFAEVHAGDLIARIDDRSYRARFDQAVANLAASRAALGNNDLQQGSREANLAVAVAQLHNAEAVRDKAQLDVDRIAPLLRDHIQSRSVGDDRAATLRQAGIGVEQARAAQLVAERALAETQGQRAGLEAAVQAAQAAVDLARIDLENTRIRAPRSGRLSEVGARPGQYVSAGTQVTALVPDQLWIMANFKETQIAGLRPGQRAHIMVDALEGEPLVGRVEGFSPATGSEFAVIRADNATGNFTRVAQRLPVRIALDPQQPAMRLLTPGMSAIVRVDAAQTPREAAVAAAEAAAAHGS